MGYIEKTNYLKETKSILKENLIDLGEEITQNTPFRNYNDAIDNIYNQMPKVTNEGNNITLLNTRKGKVINIPEGNASQESTRGVNLFNHYDYPASQTKNGVTITNNGDGSFTLNGTSTSNQFSFPLGLNETIKNLGKNNDLVHTLYYVSGNCTKGETSGTNKNVIRLNYNQSQSMIHLETLKNQNIISKTQFKYNQDEGWSWEIILSLGDSFDNFTVKYQLEIGDETTPWEPYTGGQPSPNPEYPQDIKVVTGNNKVKIGGRNLFDNNIEIGKYYDSNGEKGTDSNNYRNVNPIVVKPNTSYIFSINGVAKAINVFAYDKNMTYLGRITTSYIPAGTPFTTPNNTKYINIFRGIGDGNEKWQIEENIATTSFEPYIQPIEKELDLTGKNLFNGNWESGTIVSNGGEASDSKSIRSSFITIEELKQYTFSSIVTATITELWANYYNNNGFVSREKISTTNNGTFTAPNGITRIRFRVSSSNSININIISNVQLEEVESEQSAPSPYEPYYNYELAGIGEYKDLIFKNEKINPNYNSNLDENEWYIKGNMGKYVYNNDLTSNGYSEARIGLITPKLNVGANLSGIVLGNISLCNLMNTSGQINNTGLAGTTSTKNIRIYISTSIVPTITEARQLFAEKNLTIYFGAENPTYEKIPNNITLYNQLEELNKYIGQGGTIVIETESEEENAQLIVKASALKIFTNE